MTARPTNFKAANFNTAKFETAVPMGSRRSVLVAAVALAACMMMIGMVIGPTPAMAAAGSGPVPDLPGLEFHHDGRITRVTWHEMESSGATKIGFRLRDLEGDFRSAGTRTRPQLKFVLKEGGLYDLQLRSFRPGQSWSAWSDSIPLVGGKTVTAPWAVRAAAGDGRIHATWEQNGADEYLYRLVPSTEGQGQTHTGATAGRVAVVEGLGNDVTYRFSVRARFGSVLTDWSPPLPITPTNGESVGVALRDYRVPGPVGPDTRMVMTPTIDPDHRIESMEIELRTSDVASQHHRASYDPSAVAAPGIEGAWVTSVAVLPLDYEVVAVAKVGSAVVASSSQTWVLGAVDADGVTSKGSPTRVGTFR